MVLTFFPKVRSTTPGAFVIQVGAEPSPGCRLKRVRGRGGFAEVWEADSPRGPVALKFMPSSNVATRAREIRTLQSFLTMDKWLSNIEADKSHRPIEQKVVANRPAEAVDFCYSAT